jgi:hypothetical protein
VRQWGRGEGGKGGTRSEWEKGNRGKGKKGDRRKGVKCKMRGQMRHRMVHPQKVPVLLVRAGVPVLQLVHSAGLRRREGRVRRRGVRSEIQKKRTDTT